MQSSENTVAEALPLAVVIGKCSLALLASNTLIEALTTSHSSSVLYTARSLALGSIDSLKTMAAVLIGRDGVD